MTQNFETSTPMRADPMATLDRKYDELKTKVDEHSNDISEMLLQLDTLATRVIEIQDTHEGAPTVKTWSQAFPALKQPAQAQPCFSAAPGCQAGPAGPPPSCAAAGPSSAMPAASAQQPVANDWPWGARAPTPNPWAHVPRHPGAMAGMVGMQPVQAQPVYGPGGLRGGHEHAANAAQQAGDELSKALPINKANTPWTPFDPKLVQTDKKWELSRKGTDRLPILKDHQSNPEQYRIWRQRVADHCSIHNPQWGAATGLLPTQGFRHQAGGTRELLPV